MCNTAIHVRKNIKEQHDLEHLMIFCHHDDL